MRPQVLISLLNFYHSVLWVCRRYYRRTPCKPGKEGTKDFHVPYAEKKITNR